MPDVRGVDGADLLLLREMLRIRRFEDRCAELYGTGDIRGFMHLYDGEEAVAVGVCAHLSHEDYITSTHRGHGDVIAKGARLDRMMAELYANASPEDAAGMARFGITPQKPALGIKRH